MIEWSDNSMGKKRFAKARAWATHPGWHALRGVACQEVFAAYAEQFGQEFQVGPPSLGGGLMTGRWLVAACIAGA